MKQLLDQAETLWCHAMHGEVMWPIHGEYRCRACLRTYAIPFAAPVARTERTKPSLHAAPCEN
jgi:hypothetical protein